MQGTGPAASALKAVFLAAGLPLLCSCASARLDIIQAGPWFAPKNWRDVAVFASREEIRHPWGGIAVIHGQNTPANDIPALEKQKLKARKMAAHVGADGLIITVEEVVSGSQLGVYLEPEIYLSALAVKYVSDISTPSAK